MQQLLASLVTSLSVKDAAFESGMKAASARAKKTEQDLERSTDSMGNAVERAADRINAAMVAAGAAIASVGQKMTRAGVAMTAGITVPLALVGKKTKDVAADFESAMNNVQSAMLDASPEQLDKLAAAAMKLGPAMGRSSIEAAGAIEMLAKNGMSAAAILNGGLSAALRLAVVGQTDLAGASDLTTDIMSQFGKTSDDLPGIVDKVSGALDASKMGFDDYRLAIGQAGGVAGGLGVSFDDLNVALASTASTFASGSDAGTSFKTFLMSLNPVSKEAAGIMKQLGIDFFDASGKAKPLTEVAEILRQKLGNLSDKSRRKALTEMFGSDGMRTAIALMNQGAAGIERYGAAIDKVTADQKLKVLLDGDIAASNAMSAAAENLSIKLGEVLLPVFTAVKNGIATVLNALASAPAWFHTAMVAAAAMAAAIGPLTIAVVTLAKVALPLLLLRLGPVALAFGALVNPVGTVVLLLGRLAAQAGAATVIGMLGTRLIALAGPVGIAVTLFTLLWPLLNRTATATDAARIAQDQANAAYDTAVEKTNQLALATGKLREQLLMEAKAARQKAQDTMMAARAEVLLAKATATRARQEATKMQISTPGAAGAVTGSIMGKSSTAANAEAEFQARLRVFGDLFDTFDLWDRKIKEAEANAGSGMMNPSFDTEKEKKKKAPKGKSAEDIARDNAQYLDEIGRLRVEALEARAELNGSIEARYDATMAGIEEDRARFARSIVLDDSLDAAKRAKLTAAQEGVLAERALIAEQERSFAIEQRRYDLEIDRNEALQEEVRGQIDAAESVADRRAGALRLLDLQRQNEEAVLDQIIATKKTTDVEYSNAMARKDRLGAIYADRRAGVERDNRGPWGDFMASLPDSAAKANEAFEAVAAGGVSSLIDGLSDAMTGARSLGDVFKQVAKSIIADLIRIQIQKAIVGAIGNALGGLLGGLGGGGGLALEGATAVSDWVAT
ncbi:phage tail tape measure protein [Sphingomonas hankookensis]|uniref:phage tail tape measure protein n=1 Tax=Sphingomonas hankookensis TaxID=563996 RepID=UPI003D303871